MVRVIKELRPTWVVGENVAGIVRMALPDILSELEACGYRTRAFLIPACAVGARHRRYRVAIVGYSEHNGLSSATVTGGVETAGGGKQEGKKKASESAGAGKYRNSQDVAYSHAERELQSAGNKQDIGNGISIGCKTMADTEGQSARRLPVGEESEKPRFGSGSKDVQHSNGAGCEEQHVSAEPDKERFTGRGCDERANRTADWPAESVMDRMAHGFPNWMDGDLDFIINHYWDEEPDIPRIATGVEHRADRLKCLGNAVVPQQFYPIFKAIAEIERGD